MQQRYKINKNKVRTICNMTFTQKLNRDRHVLKLHKDEIGNNLSLWSVASDEQNMRPSFVSDDNDVKAESFPENPNPSF